MVNTFREDLLNLRNNLYEDREIHRVYRLAWIEEIPYGSKQIYFKMKDVQSGEERLLELPTLLRLKKVSKKRKLELKFEVESR